MKLRALLAAALATALLACARQPVTQQARPSILLVTLDTTRADSIGPEAAGVETPAFNALARAGRRFRQAYAVAPETLPSHASMLTGLYPAGHGVHENGRPLAEAHAVLAERLRGAGYRTAAFVSSFVLARQFGLARGFDTYDDERPSGRPERAGKDTTDRAIAHWEGSPSRPHFTWVHYFEPHTPYEPPADFATRFVHAPYLGEVAAMDRELGRLVEAFRKHTAARGAEPAILVSGDHGEGLGEHGEAQHGILLYQPTMHVPLVLTAPGLMAGVSDTPVSTRRIFHTVLDLAGVDAANSLRGEQDEVVLGEAMKPFLSYGWQPQVMAIHARHKGILAGRLEVYDILADPRETRDLGAGAPLPPPMRRSLEEYPVPAPSASPASERLSEDARRSLASLGYVAGTAATAVRKDAPRPVAMAPLFGAIERASALFVQGKYADAIPLLEHILTRDTANLDAALRLATAHSALGHDAAAMSAFRRAADINPRSVDVRLYVALHQARGAEWERAVPELERLAAEMPDRLPVLEGLAIVRERQRRLVDAVSLRKRIHSLREPTASELLRLGTLAMAIQDTAAAIESFEGARSLQGPGFRHDLQLGVLYLATRRLTEARDALDRVPRTHSEYPLALFKRAQVSVLLQEPDRAQRIEAARKRADATTRQLIAAERLFERP